MLARKLLSGGGVTVSFIATYTDPVGAFDYTFTACSLGTPSTNRMVVVAVHKSDLFSGTSEAVTVAGISATRASWGLGTGTGNPYVGLFTAKVPSGTTGTIVVDSSYSSSGCLINVFTLETTQTVKHDSSFTHGGTSITVDVPEGGAVIAAGSKYSLGGVTLTGVTETYNSDFDGVMNVVCGFDELLPEEIGRTITTSASSALCCFSIGD